MEIAFAICDEGNMNEESATPLTSVLLLSSGYRAIVDNISDAAWLKDRWGDMPR